MNNEVTDFLNQQNHPFRSEIERVRQIILAANNELTENIKWNGPNYSVHSQDRITMRIQPPKAQVQLIFHRGAKKLTQPATKLIAIHSKLLVWKENDRAIVTFNSGAEIEQHAAELTEIVNQWINASH